MIQKKYRKNPFPSFPKSSGTSLPSSSGRKNKKGEESVQKAVCKFLKSQYPKVVFRSDLGGIKLTMGQAVKVKAIQYSRAFPDLFIVEPRGVYYGYFLELKRPDETVFLKKGGLSTKEHIQEQAEMLQKLRDRGFACDFAIGFDDAKQKIINYLNNQ